MARTDSARLTEKGPAVPAMGTLATAANSLYPKGTLVGRTPAGRAHSYATADASGYPVMGISKSTINNLTGAEMGGLDDSGLVELDYGVVGFAFTGATPLPGDKLYAVDNQTVSVDPGTDRGFAGICSEVRPNVAGTLQAFFRVGPDQSGLEASASLAPILVPIPAAPAWSDGATNGLDPALGVFGFNPTIDDQPFKTVVSLPSNLDGEYDVVVRARMSISSIATDNDVTAVLVAKFDGAADAADANAQVLAVAPADFTFTIAAADVPIDSRSLYLEIDCAGTLDTHDAYLHSLEVYFVRAA
jgi:hypothetical protein